MPPVPGPFLEDLRPCGGLCFATRRISAFKMYDFHEYVFEALIGATPDYLAFGHARHAVNS